MFEVSPVSYHTARSRTRLWSIVDEMLLQTRPCSNQAPLRISNAKYGSAVDTLLHDPQTLWSGQLDSDRDYSVATCLAMEVLCHVDHVTSAVRSALAHCPLRLVLD